MEVEQYNMSNEIVLSYLIHFVMADLYRIKSKPGQLFSHGPMAIGHQEQSLGSHLSTHFLKETHLMMSFLVSRFIYQITYFPLPFLFSFVILHS